MPYVVGIDIGTTSTLAAVVRLTDEGAGASQLLALGTHPPASSLHVGEGAQMLIGDAGQREAGARPDQVARKVKREVGDPVPIVVGDRSVMPEVLLAEEVRWVLGRAREHEGGAPEAVAVAVPGSWDGYRTALVREAVAGLGVPDVVLVSEPQAAAHHYLAQKQVPVGAIVAVYDFGGGTFDAAVLRKTRTASSTVLGRPEALETLGGAELDEILFAHVVSGLGETFNGLDVDTVLTLAGQLPQAPEGLTAVGRLRRACTAAKEALSVEAETTIRMPLPGASTEVRLVRSELEEMIAPSVRETVEVFQHALSSAGVTAADLEAVLVVGGSSRIPLVTQLLSAEIDRPVAVVADPQAGVARGAASLLAEVVHTRSMVAGAATPPETGDARAVHELAGAHATEASLRLPAATVGRSAPRLRARVAVVAAAVVGLTVLTAEAGDTPSVGDAVAGSDGTTAVRAGTNPLASVAASVGGKALRDRPAVADEGGATSDAGQPPVRAAGSAGMFAGVETRTKSSPGLSRTRSASGSAEGALDAGSRESTAPGRAATGQSGAPNKAAAPSSRPTLRSTPDRTAPVTTSKPTVPAPSNPTPSPGPSPDPRPTPTPTPTPAPTPEQPPDPTPDPLPPPPEPPPDPTPTPDPAPPEPTPEPTPTPAPTPTEPTPDPTPSPSPSPEPTPGSSPTPTPTPSPDPIAGPTPGV